ncbi:MAG: InlB B-repeat-containing protein [Lachnospiraceae bacterium]|nr:InlB B-repeat-containing protein [Lachnospiraceae bacterium]
MRPTTWKKILADMLVFALALGTFGVSGVTTQAEENTPLIGEADGIAGEAADDAIAETSGDETAEAPDDASAKMADEEDEGGAAVEKSAEPGEIGAASEENTDIGEIIADDTEVGSEPEEISEDPDGIEEEEPGAEEILPETSEEEWIDESETAEGTSVISYPLHVGEYQVTSENKNNIPGILGGGKASYDPSTKTLTFSGNVTGVTGVYSNDSPYTTQIMSSDDLTIKGQAKLRNKAGSMGISCEGSLNLEGDFEIFGSMYAINNRGNITLNGNITAESGDTAIITFYGGGITIDGGYVRVRSGTDDAIFAGFGEGGTIAINAGILEAASSPGNKAVAAGSGGSIIIADGLAFFEPAGGRISTDGLFISENDGTSPASKVWISRPSDYGLYVGAYPVLEENRNDISGVTGKNAKASYDPETSTLTFRNVTGIEGTHDTGDYGIYKIASDVAVTIDGDAVIEGNCYGGIYCKDLLTTAGDLEISKVQSGIESNPGVVCKGKLSIITDKDGPFGGGISVGNFAGIEFKEGADVSVRSFDYTALSGRDITVDPGAKLYAQAKRADNVINLTAGSSTFTMNGGTVIAEADVEGSSRSVISAQTITLNWNVKIADPVNGEFRYTAGKGSNFYEPGGKFARRVKLITYDPADYVILSFDNGDCGIASLPPVYVEKGGQIDLPAGKSLDTAFVPEDPDWKFAGWYLDPTCRNKADSGEVFTEDTTLYARWVSEDIDLWTVTFVAPEPVSVPKQSVPDEECATEPTGPFYTNSGLVVDYWILENESDPDREYPYDFATPVTGNITLKAHTVPAEKIGDYEVEFIENDGILSYNEATERWETVYDGKPKTFTTLEGAADQTIRVSSPLGILEYGVDYTLSYKNNKNVSTNKKTATVTVNGRGRYKGKKTFKFHIVPLSIATGGGLNTGRGFVLEPIVTEKGKKISPVIYYNGRKLTSKEYSLSNTKKVTSDTYVNISGKGNFTGTVRNVPVKVLTKTEKKANELKVTFKANTHIHTPGSNTIGGITRYNGAPQTVTITEDKGDPEGIVKGELTVKNSKGELLKKDVDFTLTYRDNVNAGTAVLVISGQNTYAGSSIRKTFKIKPDKAKTLYLKENKTPLTADYVPGGAKLSMGDANDIDVKIYNPMGFYSEEEETLICNTDYRISYSVNKAVSTDTKKASYKITFIGNYKGHAPITGHFDVVRAQFKFAASENGTLNVTVPDLLYTKAGRYLSAPYVVWNDTLLGKNDYSVRYFDTSTTPETEITGQKIALGADETERKIRVEVTGKGNFEDQTVVRYYIVRKAADGEINLGRAKISAKGDRKKKAVGTKSYTGAAQYPGIDVYVKVKKKWVLVNPNCYRVTYVNNKNPGKATIIVSGRAGSAAGTKKTTFKIAQRNFSILRLLDFGE